MKQSIQKQLLKFKTIIACPKKNNTSLLVTSIEYLFNYSKRIVVSQCSHIMQFKKA